MTKEFDLICLGRVAVDLYAEQLYCDLSKAQTYRQYVGGCAGNIAIGTSRLGLKVAMLSKVGQDAMGDFVRTTLNEENVNTRWLKNTDKHLTGLVLLGINPPDKFPLMFYRENCADMQIAPQDCEDELFEKAKSLLITGTGFSSEAMRNISQYAIQLAHKYKQKIILDLDYRPVLWNLSGKGDGESRYIASEIVTKHYKVFLSQCDLIVGTEEELSIAVGVTNREGSILKLREITPVVLILKLGADGCNVYEHGSTRPINVPGYPVDVLNVLGAGDAFLSGFLSGYLKNLSLIDSAKLGNAAGSIVVTRHGCSPAMPYTDEVKSLIESESINIINVQSMLDLDSLNSKDEKTLCILAFDHRYQFESYGHSVSIEKISEFKRLIYKGLLNSDTYRIAEDVQSGIIADSDYSLTVLRSATEEVVAVPIEKANTQLLSWVNNEDLYSQILHRPKSWWVKVLCKLEPDMSSSQLAHQIYMLRSLQNVCESLDRVIVIELITTDVLWSLKYTLQKNIMPSWWKLSADYEYVVWKQIEILVAHYQVKPQIMVLGGGVDEHKTLYSKFSNAKTCKWVKGFAIGRNIFWQPWELWIKGEISDNQAINTIAKKYDQLVSIWQSTNFANEVEVLENA